MKNLFNLAAAFWVVGVASAYAVVAPVMPVTQFSDPGVGYHAVVNFSGASSVSSSDPAFASAGSKTTNVVTSAGNGSAFAQASFNNFKGFASANSSSGTMTVSSLSNFEANDLVFSDGASPTATTAIHLHLDGSLVDTSGFSGNQGVATVGITIAVKAPGAPFSSVIDYEIGQVQLNLNGGTAATAVPTGLLSSALNVGDNVNFDVVTNSFSVPTNIPLILELELDTSAIADRGAIAGPIVQTDFSNTLEFNPSGPVFTSPDQLFTANSTEAGIVNNTAITPEPLSLSAVALMFLLCPYRRRAITRSA